MKNFIQISCFALILPLLISCQEVDDIKSGAADFLENNINSLEQKLDQSQEKIQKIRQILDGNGSGVEEGVTVKEPPVKEVE